MLRGLLLVTVCSGPAFAQVEEFPLPPFEFDAGVSSAPPLPQPEPPPVAAKPPPPPFWTGGGSASLNFSALRDYSLGGEVTLLTTVWGTPAPSEEEPGHVEGFLFQVGVQGDYARSGGPVCRGTPFCATRFSGGAALKGGWARGLPGLSDHATRTQTMYFAQLDVLLSHFDIESAPLAPGLKTWELVTRLRLGLHFIAPANRLTSAGVAFLVAAVIEAIPVSAGTQGVSFGASVGAGF